MEEAADNVVRIGAFRRGAEALGELRGPRTLAPPQAPASVLCQTRAFLAGDFLVYPLAGDVASPNGGVRHLEPKVMDVLVELMLRSGVVVTRLELLASVWGERSAFSDESLTRTISQLRKAFADSSREPKYVQTIPKRGYRFVAKVLPLADR